MHFVMHAKGKQRLYFTENYSDIENMLFIRKDNAGNGLERSLLSLFSVHGPYAWPTSLDIPNISASFHRIYLSLSLHETIWNWALKTAILDIGVHHGFLESFWKKYGGNQKWLCVSGVWFYWYLTTINQFWLTVNSVKQNLKNTLKLICPLLHCIDEEWFNMKRKRKNWCGLVKHLYNIEETLKKQTRDKNGRESLTFLRGLFDKD